MGEAGARALTVTYCDCCGRELVITPPRDSGLEKTGHRKLQLYIDDAHASGSKYPKKSADICNECATKIEAIVTDALPGPGRDEGGRVGDPSLRNRELLKLRDG